MCFYNFLLIKEKRKFMSGPGFDLTTSDLHGEKNVLNVFNHCACVRTLFLPLISQEILLQRFT